MKKDQLEEYLEKVSENTDFTYEITEINDKEVEIEMHGDNPEGEDWWENININNPENGKELLGALYAEVLDCYESFDVEEHVYNMLDAKRNGFSGVPGVVDLVRNEEYKENALKEYADKLLDMFRSYGKEFIAESSKTDTKAYYKVETSMTYTTTVLVPEDEVSSFEESEQLVNNAVEDVTIHLLENTPECKTNAIKVVRYTKEQTNDYQIIRGE